MKLFLIAMEDRNKLDVIEWSTDSHKKPFSSKKTIKNEIEKLISSPEFIDFIQSIEESICDGITYNEFLSSQEILHKAIDILKKHK